MFLNLPPNDFNLDETLNSLYYGTRVKFITNDQNKNCENKEMNKIKGNFQKLFEEHEILKNRLKKYNNKENTILDNTSQIGYNTNKSLETRSFSEHLSFNEMQSYNSLF